MATNIVPHSKGIDICSNTKKQFAVIRSDLGCFMIASDMHEENDVGVYPLHDNCSGGDAYLADDGGWYYIIKGTKYHSCKDLSTDAHGTDLDLVDNMQGGDHYYNWGLENTIVNGDDFMWTMDMNTQPAAYPGYLSTMLVGGSYYWANKNYIYALNRPREMGVVTFNECINPVQDWDNGSDITMAMDVVSFLPGGIAQSLGKAFGKWVAVVDYSYDPSVDGPVDLKVGFDQSAVDSITENWTIHDAISEHELLKHMCQYQFSLDASYGGISTDTTHLIWDNFYELPMYPDNVLGVYWQYQFGFGETTCLYLKQFIDDTAGTTPTDPPDLYPTDRIGAKL